MGNKLAGMINKRKLQERKAEELDTVDLVEAWLPIIKRLGKPGEFTAQEMVDKLGPLGVMTLAQLMVNADSERVRYSSAKEIAYMHGMKPVERSQNINVNVMAEAEINALLRSNLEDLGVKVIEDGRPNVRAEAEVIDSNDGAEEGGGCSED